MQRLYGEVVRYGFLVIESGMFVIDLRLIHFWLNYARALFLRADEGNEPLQKKKNVRYCCAMPYNIYIVSIRNVLYRHKWYKEILNKSVYLQVAQKLNLAVSSID